jgi:hypothetical protein
MDHRSWNRHRPRNLFTSASLPQHVTHESDTSGGRQGSPSQGPFVFKRKTRTVFCSRRIEKIPEVFFANLLPSPGEGGLLRGV